MQMSDLKAAGEFAQSGIYVITNLINFKIYVGSAISIENRLAVHKKKLKYKIHSNKHLQAAYDQLGLDCFSFESLEFCEREQLLEREAYWINLTECYNPANGYNKRKVPNSNFGLKLSEETRARIGKSNIGKHSQKRRPWTEEERLKISKRNKGRKHSPEHIAKRIVINSKPDKWPHGYKCKCKPCMKLKSQAIRAKQIANAQKEQQQ